MLRIVDEFKTFLVSPPFLLIQEATSRGKGCVLLSVLKPDNELVIVFIEVDLIGVFCDLLQLLLASDFINEDLVILLVFLIVLCLKSLVFIFDCLVVVHNLVKCDCPEVTFALRLV